MKALELIATTVVCGLLASCASTLQLSDAVKVERGSMTPKRADDLLEAYARADATRGGICLIGVKFDLTRLDYKSQIEISGSVISFDAYFAKLANISVGGNVAAGTGTVGLSYKSVRGSGSIDMRSLKEIRVLDSNVNTLALCPGFKPGYLVALKADHGLSDHAQISINATSPTELNSVLAMLTYYSPGARVVSGIGM